MNKYYIKILSIIVIFYTFVLVGINCYHTSIVPSDDFVYYFKAINETLPRLYNDKGKFYHVYISFIADIWQGDIISAYLFNVITLSILPFVLFLLICIRLRLNIYYVFFLSVAYCLSASYNWEVLPKVSSFLSIFILSSVLLFVSLKWTVLCRLLLLCLLLLFSSYIRPEVTISLYILLVVVACLFFKYIIEKKYEFIELNKFVVLVLMLIVSYFTLMKLFGGSALQVDSSSGDKATVISLVQWIGNKYLVAHKQVIINDDDVQKGIELFGQMPNSILHAFQLNPSLFISHVLENIADYVQRIYHFTFNLLVVTPTDLVLGNKAFIIIILTLIALSLFFLDISKTKEQLLVAFVKHKYVVLLHLVLLLGSIILCIIFYPSRHYLINQQFFLLLVALFVISGLRFRNKGYQLFFQKALPIFMLVLVLIVQGSITFRKYNANNTVLSHKKYEFIADKLKKVNNIWGLGIDFDVCFVKKGGTAIVIIPPEEAIKTTFEEYVLKQKFNFIYVDSLLIEKTKIFKDTDTFLSSGYKKYFYKFDSPIKNEYLLIPILTK